MAKVAELGAEEANVLQRIIMSVIQIIENRG